jgi:uncharacterized protein YuzE
MFDLQIGSRYVRKFEGKMKLLFDEKGDVFDITVGRARKTVTKELKNDTAIRVDPENGEIVGIVILNFVKRFRAKKPEKVELPVKMTITLS